MYTKSSPYFVNKSWREEELSVQRAKVVLFFFGLEMGEGDIWQYTYIHISLPKKKKKKKSCDQDTKGNTGY